MSTRAARYNVRMDRIFTDAARLKAEAAQARVVEAARGLMKAMDNPHRREPPSLSPLRAALAELDKVL
jgi:hypothetical protein